MTSRSDHWSSTGRRALTIAVLLTVWGVACGSDPPSEPATQAAVEVTPVLAVAPTAEGIVKAWLDALTRAEPAAKSPTVLVVDETLALGMLAGGTVSAAVVHRRATDAESRDASSEGLAAAGRLEHLLLARDSIAIAVHPSNPLAAVTRAQARGLLTGQLTWDDLPGPPPSSGGGPVLRAPEGPAHVYLRGVGHSSMRGLALLRVKEPTPEAVRLGSDEAVVERLAGDPAGLALVPSAVLIADGGAARGKALGLGGPDEGPVVLPGAGVRGGAIWPLLRPLYLVRAADPGTAAAGLLEFAHSLPGKRITMDRGFLPASPLGPSRRPPPDPADEPSPGGDE